MEKLNTKYLMILVATIFLGCHQNDKIDYCKMLERDQSFVNRDTTDMIRLEADRAMRHELIKNNFRQLIEYSRQNGFPEMGKLNVSGLDSCRNWAVFMTIFHIGQIEPNLFFEDETVSLIKNEIENGNLKSSSIFTSLREGFNGHEFCESRRDEIYSALDSWDIPIDELPSIRFKKCTN